MHQEQQKMIIESQQNDNPKPIQKNNPKVMTPLKQRLEQLSRKRNTKRKNSEEFISPDLDLEEENNSGSQNESAQIINFEQHFDEDTDDVFEQPKKKPKKNKEE